MCLREFAAWLTLGEYCEAIASVRADRDVFAWTDDGDRTIGGIVNQERFEEWAILELFGHQRFAGRVSEALIGGAPFVRLDVPEANGVPGFTRFFGTAYDPEEASLF